MFKTSLILAAILFALPLSAQEIVECPTKTFWYIPGTGATNYSLLLPAKPKTTDHPQVIMLNNSLMQYLLVSTKEFIKAGEDNDEVDLLVRYVTYESQYMADTYKGDFNMQLQMEQLPNGKKALYWYFDVPNSGKDEAKRQHFIEVITGDTIFGLAATQFEGQEPETIRKSLVQLIGTLAEVKDKDSLCK